MFQIYEVEKPLCSSSHNCVGQKLPEDWEIKKSSFLKFVWDQIKENNFSIDQVINMDEMPLTFDWFPSRTVNKVGKNTVDIVTSSQKKPSLTYVLSCTASGVKLKPLLILLNEKILKENFSKMFWSLQMRKVGLTRHLCKIGCTKSGGKERKGAFFSPKKLFKMDSLIRAC